MCLCHCTNCGVHVCVCVCLCTDKAVDLLGERSLKEVYYLWRLAGGDLETTLRREGLIPTKPPIINLAR